MEKRLQFIVSQEIVEEYLEIFDELLEFGPAIVEEWRERFDNDPRVTVVNLGPWHYQSRDPDDNVFLSTAQAGKAKFLVTNDRDLLELPESFLKTLPFSILKPIDFLASN